MQISSRFSIAVHILACIGMFQGEHKLTSDFIAGSVNVNPVVIRRILQQLKGAGIVEIARGSGGASLARDPDKISLFDIYDAVECVSSGRLFHFHENPNSMCPVGRNIHTVLDGRLDHIQKAMEDEMKKITMADIISDTKKAEENGSG